MRIQLVLVAILPLLGFGCIENVPEQAPSAEVQEPAPLGCTIRAEPTCELGQVPDVTVAITNQSNADVYLVGSLDKSDYPKWRYPYCYFEVTGPDGKSPVELIAGCLNTNTLREEDFVKVPPGGTFDPYQEIDDYGFAPACRQLNPHTFRKAGEYRTRFVYSTRSDNIAAWAGDGAWTPAQYEKVVGLLRQVPKVEVRSNEIKITVVERGKERPR